MAKFTWKWQIEIYDFHILRQCSEHVCEFRSLGISELGSLKVCKIRNLRVYEFGSLKICKFRSLGIFKFGNLVVWDFISLAVMLNTCSLHISCTKWCIFCSKEWNLYLKWCIFCSKWHRKLIGAKHTKKCLKANNNPLPKYVHHISTLLQFDKKLQKPIKITKVLKGKYGKAKTYIS